jgi:hypothetical protein
LDPVPATRADTDPGAAAITSGQQGNNVQHAVVVLDLNVKSFIVNIYQAVDINK